MRIILGDGSKKYMKILHIESFPFTQDELKSKYREQLKIHHEDVGGSKGKTQEIIEAYTFLKDMVYDNIEKVTGKKKYKGGMFDISEPCSECHGVGSRVKKKWGFKTCHFCGGGGTKERKCHFCDAGKFTLRSGRKVDCRRCSGTGKVTVKSNCFWCSNTGEQPTEEDSSERIECLKCEGTGRTEKEMFNPVIPKGAVLF